MRHLSAFFTGALIAALALAPFAYAGDVGYGGGGGLRTCSHDSTLTGNCTAASPAGLNLGNANIFTAEQKATARTASAAPGYEGTGDNNSVFGYGIYGHGSNAGAAGVRGASSATSPGTEGISSGSGPAVNADASGGTGYGVYARGNSTKAAIHVYGESSAPSTAAAGDVYYDTTSNTLKQYTGSSWVAVGTGGWPTRRTAPDASDYLTYTMNESALPLANGVSAQGSNGNLDTAIGGTLTYGQLGFFSNAVLNPNTTRSEAYGSLSTTLEPAQPITLSAWVLPLASPNGEIFSKKAQPQGTWTGEVIAVGLGFDAGGTGRIVCNVGVANTLHACTSAAAFHVTVGVWNHIGCTYNGVQQQAYLNGNLVATCAQTGAIDYQTHGPWYVGTNNDNTAVGTAMTGYIDDVRVATVARPASYFQTIWTTATGQGGN